MHLLGVAVQGSDGLNARLASLVVRKAVACGILHAALAGDDLLDGGQNAAPVLEDGEGDVLARAVGDEVCDGELAKKGRKASNRWMGTYRGPSWRRGGRSRGRRKGRKHRRRRRRGWGACQRGAGRKGGE